MTIAGGIGNEFELQADDAAMDELLLRVEADEAELLEPIDGPVPEPNNWLSFFSGSAWQFDEQTGEYYLHLFSRKQPDLNWENPKVRLEVFKMMNWCHNAHMVAWSSLLVGKNSTFTAFDGRKVSGGPAKIRNARTTARPSGRGFRIG